MHYLPGQRVTTLPNACNVTRCYGDAVVVTYICTTTRRNGEFWPTSYPDTYESYDVKFDDSGAVQIVHSFMLKAIPFDVTAGFAEKQ